MSNKKFTHFNNEDFRRACIVGRYQRLAAGHSLPRWVTVWVQDVLVSNDMKRVVRVTRLIDKGAFHG